MQSWLLSPLIAGLCHRAVHTAAGNIERKTGMDVPSLRHKQRWLHQQGGETMVHVVSEQSGLSGETFPKSAGFVSHIHLERNDGGRSKHTWQVIGQTSSLSHSEQKVQNFFYCWWASLMVQEKLLCSSINLPTGSYYPATAAASALISSVAADLAVTVPASSFF